METEKSIEQPNSTEISINAKNMHSGKVKCYGITMEESYDKAIKYAKKLEELIIAKNGG